MFPNLLTEVRSFPCFQIFETWETCVPHKAQSRRIQQNRSPPQPPASSSLNFFHLVEAELHRRLTAEDVHQDLELALILADLGDLAIKV